MHPIAPESYARAMKAALPPRVHEAAISRLWWLPTHYLVVVAGIGALALGWVPLYLAAAVSLVLGVSFAGLTFLAHETLHGSVVRGRRWQRGIGWLCFLPFCISPRLWVAWHNRAHHGRTQEADVDPDAFPTLDRYLGSGIVRFMVGTLGAHRGAPAGLLALIVGFSVHSTHMLLGSSAIGLLSRQQRRQAVAESLIGLGFWLALGWWLGWVPFVFGFAIPLLLANTIVMAHILTNHSLSPLTMVNDPLLNSLSVTVPRWFEFLTLGFGFHVEHHLHPWMSPRHARTVRDLVQERWPDRYQSMPLWRALLRIYTTPRIYAEPTRLIDPRSGRQWSTLPARTEPAQVGVGLEPPPHDDEPALEHTAALASSGRSSSDAAPVRRHDYRGECVESMK